MSQVLLNGQSSSTQQSRCLLDHGSSAGQLDHSAEGLLPGERFGADQQCTYNVHLIFYYDSRIHFNGIFVL